MFLLTLLPLYGLLFTACNTTNDTRSPLLEEGGVETMAVDVPANDAASTHDGLKLDLGKKLVLSKEISTIEERVKYFSLRRSERVWDKIPWVTEFETAQALSEKTNRPIFMFSMWGELDGRC